MLQGRIKIKNIRHYRKAVTTLRELGYKPVVGSDTDELTCFRACDEQGCCWLYCTDNGYWYLFKHASVVRHAVKFTLKEFTKRMTKIIKGCTCHPSAQVNKE